MDKICGLYEILNETNDIRYVGSSSHIYQRLVRHRGELRKNKHGNQYLQNAWNKYGEKAFVFRILSILTEEEKLPAEQKLLDEVFASGCGSYNIAKDAMASMTGRQHSLETRRKMSETQRGREFSVETKQLMSDAHKKRAAFGEKNPFYGMKHSEEVKAKMSKARKARGPASAETREKIGAASRGKKLPPFSLEHRAKMSVAAMGRKKGPQSPEHIANRVASNKAKRLARIQIAPMPINMAACYI